jgi:hypothetical protein
VHSRLLGEPFRRSDRGNHEFPLWAVLRDSPSEDFGVLLRLNTTTKIVTRPFPEIRLASFTDGRACLIKAELCGTLMTHRSTSPASRTA